MNATALTYDLEYQYDPSKGHQLDFIWDPISATTTDFTYNTSGSITQIDDPSQAIAQNFFWNEQQQLTGVSNQQGVHHYVYDHSGERIMKSSLINSTVYLNDQVIDDVSNLEPYTVYVNPYYVVTGLMGGDLVSKHYYMNQQRVATDITINYDPNGGGGPKEQLSAKDPASAAPELSPALANFNEVLFGLGQKPLDTASLKLPTIASYYPEAATTPATSSSAEGNPSAPRILFWYHPDYLGNVDLITERDGYTHEFFMYNPWGEEMHQWNANTYAFTSPYRFNAKELDPETGLAYYGARYYQNKIGVWLSVDPKAMVKSNLNGAPYIFSSNNPIMKFDPDGLDDGWIKNVLTDEYVWHDAATSQSTTPVGFKFVGMSNNDVVRDLGYPTQSVSREHRTLATVPVGDGSSDFGISYFANATLDLTARITTSITLNVVNEHSKVSSTNKQGMIIRGLDVNLSGTVSTLNNGNLNGLGTSLSGNAAISVTTSGFSTTQPLRKPQRRDGESIMTEVGSIGVAKVLIPLTTAKLGNSITVKYDGLWSTRGVPVYGPTIFGMLYTPKFSGAFKFNSKNHESE